MKEVNGSIDSLKHTIYALSDEEVARIQREKKVDPSISKEKGTLADNQTLEQLTCTIQATVLLEIV